MKTFIIDFEKLDVLVAKYYKKLSDIVEATDAKQAYKIVEQKFGRIYIYNHQEI